MTSLIKLLLGLVILTNAACSTSQIIRNSEYANSEASYRSGDVPQAVRRFPKKEDGGFVTSIEKSWLLFWLDENDNTDLMKQVSTLDNRRYTSISREAQYFFYNESEDGYIPAEHEIIVMHMLNAMLFMRQKKWAAARVEARRATFFLQNYFREDQNHFDDPALRLWLAGIWASLGEWNEAQVDLRKAYELTKNKALLPLLESTNPPAEFTVVFTGGGPTVKWYDGESIPTFTNDTSAPSYKISFETMPWYKRHLQRNTEIRDVIMKSNYMAQYYGLNTSVGAEKTVGYTAANTLRLSGILLGTVVVVGAVLVAAKAAEAGVSEGAGEFLGYAVAGGLTLGSSVWKEGDKVSASTAKNADKRMKEGLENLKTYRYVRFMPSWISVTDKYELQTPQRIVTYLKSPNSKTEVQFVQAF